MALEVAAFRIVGRTFGTALRETTTVIAVFMTAMRIGYWGGGRGWTTSSRRADPILTDDYAPVDTLLRR